MDAPRFGGVSEDPEPPTLRTAKPPPRLVRVCWEAAVGFPYPERRRVTARNFATDEAVGRQLAIIAALPSHLTLLGVWETTCTWQPVDPASFAAPGEEEHLPHDD